MTTGQLNLDPRFVPYYTKFYGQYPPVLPSIPSTWDKNCWRAHTLAFHQIPVSLTFAGILRVIQKQSSCIRMA